MDKMPKNPTRTAGGVHSNIKGRKAHKALSDQVISVWGNTKNHALVVNVWAGNAKDGSEDRVEIEYQPNIIEHDLDGTGRRIFSGTFEELIAQLKK